jgi:uncharacterized protein YutE (UPF0331/DUF86 family)
MVIDRETIENKLKKLEEVIVKLEECKKVKKEDFAIDFRISDAAMYNLIQGIEIIIDIGNHILSEVFHITADEYAQVIEKLGETNVIPPDFAEENINMARFRNLIIHAYEKIDLDKVYQNLQKAPDIFRQFAKYYLEFLEKLV